MALEIKATELATTIAGQHGITRNAAFDAILVTASELNLPYRRFTTKQAAEIEAIIARNIRDGVDMSITRKPVGN